MEAPIYHESTDRRCATSQLEQDILTTLRARGLDLVPQVKRRSWVFDAAVQGTRILIEVDGDYWHSLPHAKERDARKEAWAAQHGYTIIRVAEAAYRADPEGQIDQVVQAVTQAVDAAKVDKVDTDAEGRPVLLSSFHFDDWRDRFIGQLAALGNVRSGCLAAGISRAAAYKRRDTDAEFALAWDEALANFADLLEGAYAQRAIEQSDRAMEFLLKANRRDKYGDRMVIDGLLKHIDYGTLTIEQLERIAAGDDVVAVVLGGR